MDDFFTKLNEKDFFIAHVTETFGELPDAYADILVFSIELDVERIEFAFVEYTQHLRKLELVLHSHNPDQYKRSGALLHALHQSKIIKSVNLSPELGDLECGFSWIPYAEAQELIEETLFFEKYANEIFSFDLAYKTCVAYEEHQRPLYSLDYAKNVAHYLWLEDNLSVDSCVMIFKSLMQ